MASIENPRAKDERIQEHPQRSSPTTLVGLNDARHVAPNIRLSSTDVMVVIFAWEKLRLIFNLVLLLIGAYYFTPLGVILFAPVFLEWALLANLCFCAGPVVECYLCLLLFPRKGVRWLVFLTGLAMSIPLVATECIKFATALDK
jgi:hypothetical protein